MLDIDCQKSFGAKFNLDIKLQIPSNKFVSLYGKSGSGKSTLLRLIAGFEKADSGYIKNGDRLFFDNNTFLLPQKREVGFLFQDYALFPNMSVIKNLLFAKKDRDLAMRLLHLMGLEELKNATPTKLSGGEKQRVALARALMRKPNILLLDEPLSALDTNMRTKLQDYLIKIQSQFQTTIILVSHDISEIYKLASIVYEIENGKIINIGSAKELFLKTSGSQKFSFLAKLLELKKQDSIVIATILVGSQLSQVALTKEEAKELIVGENIKITAKAFGLKINKISGGKDE